MYLKSPQSSSESVDANTSIEPVGLGRGGQQVIRNRSLSLRDVSQLVVLAGTRVERPAKKQFSQYTAQ